MEIETPTADSGTETTTEAVSEPTSEPSFDMDSAVDRIAQELFPGKTELDGPINEAVVTPVTEPVAPPTPVSVRPAPKAWPKEMHEHWGKVDPAVQEFLEKREQQMVEGLSQYTTDAKYGKTLKEVIAPFESTLKQYRLEPHQAVQSLMTAHVRLTQGTMESRLAAYKELGNNLGLSIPPTTTNGETTPTPVDPQIQAIQQQVQSLQQSLTAREEADLKLAQQRVSQEVEAFAADTKAHPHFQEVAETITALLKGGVCASLQEAYENAVRMNPVTHAKELAAAQQAEAAKLRENARLDALKAKTAASSNVRPRESKRTPTEPVGTMEDTIRETLRNRKAQVAT